VSALGQLLERLRRVRLPPGAAASVVAVPSAADELSREVEFLFEPLDEFERRCDALVSAASAQAAAIEAAALEQRRRILDEASAQAERIVAGILAESRARSEERARIIEADAEREAARVRARGRERSAAVVAEIVERILADA